MDVACLLMTCFTIHSIATTIEGGCLHGKPDFICNYVL